MQLTILGRAPNAGCSFSGLRFVNDHDDEVRAAFARLDEGRQRIILFQEQSRRAAADLDPECTYEK